MKWLVAVFLYILCEGIACQLQSEPQNNCTNDHHHIPHIEKLDVKCEQDGIIVDVEFDEPFQGVIYSKGHFGNPECRYVMANSNLNRYHFIVPMTGCGTSSEISGNVGFYNTLIFQNDNIVQEVWDIARKISCEWESKFEKRVMFDPISVNMIDAQEVRVIAEDITCWMDIKRGNGPFAPSLTSSAKAGEELSLVIYIGDKSGDFDMLVKNCVASDSKDVSNVKTNVVQLTDDKGCSLKPKLFANFEKTRSTGNTGASIISFATFSAFLFPDSNQVYFSCNVELCKHECAPTCEDAGRPSISVTLKSELCGPGSTHPFCTTSSVVTKLETSVASEITTKSRTFSDFTKKIAATTFPLSARKTPSEISLITPKITTKAKTIPKTALSVEIRRPITETLSVKPTISTTKRHTVSVASQIKPEIVTHLKTSTVGKTATSAAKRPTVTFSQRIVTDRKETTTSAKTRSTTEHPAITVRKKTTFVTIRPETASVTPLTTATTKRTIVTATKRLKTTFQERITSDTKATTIRDKTRSTVIVTKLPIPTVTPKTPTIAKRPTTVSFRPLTETATKRTRPTITTLSTTTIRKNLTSAIPGVHATKSQTAIITRRPLCAPGDTSPDCLTPLSDIMREFICTEDSTDIRCLRKSTSPKPEWTGDSRYHSFHAYLYQKAPRPRSGGFRRFSRSLYVANATEDSKHLRDINLSKGYIVDSSYV